MIQPNELRIGNYITTALDLGCIVDGIEKDCIFFLEHGFRGYMKPKDCLPISINDKLLVRFGFEKEERGSEDDFDGVEIVYNKLGVDIFELSSVNKYAFATYTRYLGRGFKGGNYIEYVHQLQNLYFALTGNELTLNQI